MKKLTKKELLYLIKELEVFKRNLESNIRYAKDNFSYSKQKMLEVKTAEKELCLIVGILKKLALLKERIK